MSSVLQSLCCCGDPPPQDCPETCSGVCPNILTMILNDFGYHSAVPGGFDCKGSISDTWFYNDVIGNPLCLWVSGAGTTIPFCFKGQFEGIYQLLPRTSATNVPYLLHCVNGVWEFQVAQHIHYAALSSHSLSTYRMNNTLNCPLGIFELYEATPPFNVGGIITEFTQPPTIEVFEA